VYGIITQAAGDVYLYSSPGIGTTVTTLLPVTEEDPAPVGRAKVTLRTSHGETVLVAEDEDALREVTCRALTRNGYRVLAAASGPEAVRAARLHHGDIHLLLTDVIMPQMFGKEVVEAIRVLRPETRVLYMSGYSQRVLTSQGNLEPSVVLVEKPFSEHTLLDKIREVLDRPP
jgi:CheY-like chemotaxis protein